MTTITPELGVTITPTMDARVLAHAARAMAELAVNVIIDKLDTPYRFPGVDDVAFGQNAWIMADAERYLRRRGAGRSEVDGFVWEAMTAAKVARDYAGRAAVSGKAVDRVRVWRAYEDAAWFSRLARM